MSRNTRGCGCVLAAVLAVAAVAAGVGYKFLLPWWKQKPPPASGKDMKVMVLDVGQGDSILIISPTGKTMLIDAGDETKGKQVLKVLQDNGVKQLDYFVATHMHPDHIGGAPVVLGGIKTETVLENGFPPPEMPEESAQQSGTSMSLKKALDKNAKPQKTAPPPPTKGKKNVGKTYVYPTVTAYNAFKQAVSLAGAKFERATPGEKIDLGGGAILEVLAPIEPFFTKAQVSDGGNEPNANSIVMRLIYGEFSMMLPGDAETQAEQRIISKDTTGTALTAKILKVAHHGSKYATSDEWLKSVKPEVAIISDGEYNRYGHPSQAVLDRLKANQVGKVYRTDLQGTITITTEGKTYKVTTEKETKTDVWTGREGTKDDSSKRGFITYGDFGPPPKPRKEKEKK